MLTTQLFTSKTGTGASSAIDVQGVRDQNGVLMVQTSGGAGAMEVAAQISPDGGTTWVSIASVTDADISATGSAWVEFPLGPKVRVNVLDDTGGYTYDAWITE